MNKTELVVAVAEKAGITKAEASKVVAATFDAITEALASGDKVTLVGFGTFSVKDRAARTGINPRTKETVEIPATKTPAFKATNALKEAVK